MGSSFVELDNSFRPQQIYEQVSERIRAEIQSGRFAAESRLPSERDLAGLFGVGRPAVREAIGALQNEGLVVTKRNSGTFVCANVLDLLSHAHSTQSSTPRVADFSPMSTLEVRLVLEPAIVRRAAVRAQRDRLAEQYLTQMESVHDIDDLAQRDLWNTSDRLFHRQLAVMTGDGLMVKIADEVAKTMDQPLWRRLKDEAIYEAGRIRLYVAEHRLIYEAVVNGDADAAAFYVEQHIKRVSRDLT
jgi:DNA-binding FadR family transcriptional regulator